MSENYYRKFIQIPAIFNNENLLEFSIEPDKRSLSLKDSYLRFYVELAENFVPDNNFCNKLFEFLDLTINFEDVSFKSSNNDYDLTSMINNKIFQTSQFLKKFPFEGHFDEHNFDSSELKANTDIIKHRRGKTFKKNVMVDGTAQEKTFYRYMLMFPINHGLTHAEAILPPGVHVRLTFHRARAEKSLIDISEEIDINYPDKVVKIMEPAFVGCWAFGKKLDTQLGRVSSSGLNIEYDSAHVRHKVLDEGLVNHRVEVSQGPLPESIIFFLMEPVRFANDFKLSSSKFEMHNLIEFSLLLDNVVQEHYPLKSFNYGNDKFNHTFYRRWLSQTGKILDEGSDFLSEQDYLRSNFFIVENFEDFVEKDGHLAVDLKFQGVFDTKLFLCWMPIQRKILKFDRNLSVQVT